MTISPVTLTDAIRNSFLYHMNNIHTAIPGQIVDYDYTTQKASVQPTIKKSWTDGTSENLPIINSVPVIFPASGGASITFPVNAGDTCLLVCCERSIDQWMSSGDITKPLDPRKFDLTDAVALMGLTPFSNTFPPRTNNTDLVITYAGSTISITPTGEIKINTASSIALGSPSIDGLGNQKELINQLLVMFTAFQADAALFAILTTSKPFLAQFIANMSPYPVGIGGTLP